MPPVGSAHWRLHRRGQRADKRSDLDTRSILRCAVPRQYHSAEPAELSVADIPAVRTAAERQRARGQLLHHTVSAPCPISATYATRIDHNFSSRDVISGNYVFNDTYEAQIPIWGHDQRNNLGTSENASGSYLHTFSPTLINEFRTGWHTFFEGEVFGTTNDPAYDVAGKMQLPLVSRLPEEYGPPSISISGPDGAYSVYDLQRQIGPRVRSNSIWQYIDTLSWQRREALRQDRRGDRSPQRHIRTGTRATRPIYFRRYLYRLGAGRLHARLREERQHQPDAYEYRPLGLDAIVLHQRRLEDQPRA